MRKVLLCILIFLSAKTFSQVAFLDNSFGVSGKVLTDLDSTQNWINDIVLQSDGKIVSAGGLHVGGHRQFALSRHNQDGSLDSTFGLNGKLTTTFPNGAQYYSTAFTVALQADGKIIAAGDANYNGYNYFALCRYNTDGTVDTSFNYSYGGKITFHIGSYTLSKITSIAIQPDGKIVAAGQHQSSFGFTSLVVFRFMPDGFLDPSFGSNGILTSGIISSTGLTIDDVALQPDGKIIIAGARSIGVYNFVMARFNADGSLDTLFNPQGTPGHIEALSNTQDLAKSVLLLPNGKILLAGNTNDGTDIDFTIMQFNTNGTLDSSFGTNGRVKSVTSGLDEIAEDAALQPDGKIVVVGRSGIDLISNGIRFDFAIARFDSDGNLDSTFGNNGRLTTSLSVSSYANAVAIQTDGKIVAAGAARSNTEEDFALARYQPIATIIPCSAAFAIYPDSINQGIYWGYNQNPDNDLTYLWQFGDGDSSILQYPTHIYTTPGQYYVCLTISDTSGCSHTYCDVFGTEDSLMSQLNVLDPNATVGIIDIVDNFKITVYPNPATNQLNINLDGLQAEQVNIYNVEGKLVSEVKQPINNRIDISTLSKGLYLVRMTANEKSVYRKIIITD